MSTNPSKPALLIGVDETVKEVLQSTFNQQQFESISDEKFFEIYESLSDGVYSFVIAGDIYGKDLINEVGQILALQCPYTAALAVGISKDNFDLKQFQKNGFKYAYLWNLDREMVIEKVKEAIQSAGSQRVYKRISSFDLNPKTKLEFDTFVFLPLNNRFVRFTAKGTEFSENKKAKLEEKNMRNLHVDIKDIDKFYEYSATQLAELTSEANPMSDTEKEEKLSGSIRDLFYQVLDENATPDFTAGKQMISTCQKIISSYITQGSSTNWYGQLIRAMRGQTGDYSHAGDVSTYAALFGIALKHPRIEDLAMAGMLHDVGHVEVAEEILEKADFSEEELTDGEKEVYYSHIKKGLDLLKRSRMVLTDDVIKAIEQHHEKWNGKGFPKGRAGDMISEDAQILSIADRFQRFTTIREGKRASTPLEALEKIFELGVCSREKYGKIKKLLSSKTS